MNEKGMMGENFGELNKKTSQAIKCDKKDIIEITLSFICNPFLISF